VPGVDYICTLALARRACELPSNKLPDVAAEFGVTLVRHHDASADARCAAEVAVAMARRHGHDKLEQLAQFFNVSIGHPAVALSPRLEDPHPVAGLLPADRPWPLA
jgi:DNA polymerase III subunit epsilon